LRVAVAQLQITLGQPERNIARSRQLLSVARQHGAEIVLLPELWTTGYDLERAAEHGINLTDDSDNELSQLAQDFGIYLCGSALESFGGKFFNALTIHSPSGELLAIYRKIHLFGPLQEPKFLGAGDQVVTADLPWGKTGLAICYDLRFPELFRAYTLEGTRLILLSAEWPHPRLEHWRTLLRARAIENQSYVIACNAVGQANETIFFGHSMIINQWGEVLEEAEEAETVLFREIDLAEVDRIRTQFPVLADRREDLYSQFNRKKTHKTQAY